MLGKKGDFGILGGHGPFGPSPKSAYAEHCSLQIRSTCFRSCEIYAALPHLMQNERKQVKKIRQKCSATFNCWPKWLWLPIPFSYFANLSNTGNYTCTFYKLNITNTFVVIFELCFDKIMRLCSNTVVETGIISTGLSIIMNFLLQQFMLVNKTVGEVIWFLPFCTVSDE